MRYFSTLFGKELYIFRTDLLSIIRSLNTVFTAIGICHTSYVAVRQWGQELASRRQNVKKECQKSQDAVSTAVTVKPTLLKCH